jgi:hypothetical protein
VGHGITTRASPSDEAIMLDLEQEPDINIAKALRPIQLAP